MYNYYNKVINIYFIHNVTFNYEIMFIFLIFYHIITFIIKKNVRDVRVLLVIIKYEIINFL